MLSISQETHSPSPSLVAEQLQALQMVVDNKSLGFHQLPERQELWDKTEILCKSLRAQKALVVLGVGGSALGGQVIAEALWECGNKKKVYFWDNIDPLRIEKDFSELVALGLEQVTFAAISKSGGTLETLALIEYIAGLTGNDQFLNNLIVVTEEKSSRLYDLALKRNLPILPVPFDVGGRFSVLSPVGLVVAGFLGLDFHAMRQGATQALMDKEKVARLVAQCLLSFQRQEWITVLWAYSASLRDFGFWAQQLWSESLPKLVTKTGSKAPRVSSFTPCVGVTHQHSILQQFAEGEKDKFIIFLRSIETEAAGLKLESKVTGLELIQGLKLGEVLKFEYMGTQKSLAQRNSQMTLSLEKLNPASIAYLFMFFELVVATLGESLQIDAFNQPGVEAGKIIANQLMQEEK